MLYIGPRPSHLSEIADRLGGAATFLAASHGAPDEIVAQIQNLRRAPNSFPRNIPPQLAAFSKATLLPRLVALLEQSDKLQNGK